MSTFQALWRKAFLDGKWQYLATVKNPQSFSLRRFAPIFLVLLLAGSGLMAIFFPAMWALIAVGILLYLCTGFYFGSSQSGTAEFLTRILLPFFAFPFHVCYGMGTLAGLWHVVRKPAHPKAICTTGPLQHSSEARGNEKTL